MRDGLVTISLLLFVCLQNLIKQHILKKRILKRVNIRIEKKKMSQLDDSVRDPNLAFVGTKFCREWYVRFETFRLHNIYISYRSFPFLFQLLATTCCIRKKTRRWKSFSTL